MSEDGRIMDVNENKVGVIRTLLKRAKKKIYLCDESKIGNSSKFNIAHADEVDRIITTAPQGSFLLSPEKVIYCSLKI